MAGAVSNKTLDEKLDRLVKSFDEMKKETKKRFEQTERKIENLNTDIRGNGERGLKERASLVERDIKQITDDTDEIKEYQKWQNRLIVGTLFTGFIGIITTIVLFYLLQN